MNENNLKDLNEYILKNTSIKQVMEGIGYTLISNGRQYKALCNFHNDSKPSMIVSEDKSICKCFACGEGGNTITIVQKTFKCSYFEAIDKIAEITGIEINFDDFGIENRSYSSQKFSYTDYFTNLLVVERNAKNKSVNNKEFKNYFTNEAEGIYFEKKNFYKLDKINRDSLSNSLIWNAQKFAVEKGVELNPETFNYKFDLIKNNLCYPLFENEKAKNIELYSTQNGIIFLGCLNNNNNIEKLVGYEEIIGKVKLTDDLYVALNSYDRFKFIQAGLTNIVSINSKNEAKRVELEAIHKGKKIILLDYEEIEKNMNYFNKLQGENIYIQFTKEYEFNSLELISLSELRYNYILGKYDDSTDCISKLQKLKNSSIIKKLLKEISYDLNLEYVSLVNEYNIQKQTKIKVFDLHKKLDEVEESGCAILSFLVNNQHKFKTINDSLNGYYGNAILDSIALKMKLFLDKNNTFDSFSFEKVLSLDEGDLFSKFIINNSDAKDVKFLNSAFEKLQKAYQYKIVELNIKTPDRVHVDFGSKMNKITQKYIDNLYSEAGINALNFLHERGFTDAIIKQYKLGYSINKNELSELDNKELSEYVPISESAFDYLNSIGLIKVDYTNPTKLIDVFKNRLMIPIFDISGEVVAYSGRKLLENDEAKYVNSSNSRLFNKSKVLFNMNFAKKTIRELDEAIIVEGYFDAIKMTQHNFYNTVATMGTALTQDGINQILEFSNNIIYLFDGDNAGISAAEKAMKQSCENKMINAFVVILPDKLDPDEFLEIYGEIELRKYIFENKMNDIEFKIYQNLNKFDPKNYLYFERKLNETFKLIKESSDYEKDKYLLRISQMLSTDLNSVHEDFKYFVNRINYYQKNTEERK